MNHLTHFLYVTVTFLYLGISQPGFFNIIDSDKNLIKTSKSEIGSSLSNVSACEIADICSDITSAQTLLTAPTDVNCWAFSVTSISGCMEGATPENIFTDCGFSDHPTVWFKIETDTNASQLYTFVSTEGTWQPVWAVYSGTCANLSLVPGGNITFPTTCSNSDSNPDAHNTQIPLNADGTPIQTFYIAVSGVGVIDNPDFTLSAFTQATCVSCVGNDDYSSEATFEITDRSSGRSLDDTQFCQGEEVTVCIEFYYNPGENGVDWFHGLIPNFGRGWDMDYFDPNNVLVSPAGAEYLGPTDEECAPYITETMPLLCSYVDDLGILRLCNIKSGTCPCSPPLVQGSPLPFGWFWSSNGGAGCQNNCNPATRYGFPGSQTGLTVEICMNLRTRIVGNGDDCQTNSDLQISFVTTSDGVSGCWNDPVGECKLGVAQIGPDWEIDCSELPDANVTFEDTEIAYGGRLHSEFTAADSTYLIKIVPIPNPMISGMNEYLFTNGTGTITDRLFNLSDEPETAQYLVTSLAGNNFCFSKSDTFTVIVSPSLCDAVLPFAQWESCNLASQNTVICQLSILDQMCGEMFNTISSDPSPNPLCPDGGLAHNMSWIAFVAGEGNYDIVVTPSNCQPGSLGQLGAQIGVYTDCTFSESIICNAPCDTEPVTIPDSLLTQGKTYYLFIDGCSGSVCKYDIDVIGTYSSQALPCDDNDPNTINDMYDENCECKGETRICDPVLPFAQWESCNLASQNTVICQLSILDQMCGEMFNTISSDPSPNPLCPDGGMAHNMSWIAFVAGEGNYDIVVTPSNCQPGSLGQLGAQIGVYTDCTFTESIICNAPCDTEPVRIPDSLLTPGKTYYLFIDGCSGSVCKYDIDVIGTYSSQALPCDDNDPNTINDRYDENCECKGETKICDPVLPFDQWESCNIASQNTVICNLSILDQMCGEMFNTVSSDPAPNPLCPDGGLANNMTWIAFVAGEGTYDIVVTPSNCQPGTGGQIGTQIGVYTDCTFTESIICNAPCDTEPVTIPDSLLTPGETYYLFIDGCAQSVCDYTIDVIGTYSSSSLPCDDNDPNTINDMYNDDCICKGEQINTTGNEKLDDIKIFPNPTNENVFVLHTGITGDMVISLLNSVGEKITIQSSKVENGYELHTANLPSGVYFIRVQKDQTKNTYRMVKY
jgi:hypothetical protein